MSRTSTPARLAGAGLLGLVAAGVLLAATTGPGVPVDRGPVYPASYPTGDASPTGDVAPIPVDVVPVDPTITDPTTTTDGATDGAGRGWSW